MIKFKKILTALTICLVAASAAASDSTKIRIWVGWAPGGPVDIQARILQKHILMYQPDSTVIVEYHPGANGGIGLSKFTRHTESGEFVNLYIDTPNILISKFITKTNKVDLSQEIRIGTVIGVEQMLIMTSKQSGINSIYDLRSSQKSVINYGSSGIGSLSHLTTAYIESVVKQNYNHIPFKGSAHVFPDLINGNLDMFSVFYSIGSTHVLSQRVNAIAITGKQRNAALPQVPTLEEQGIKNYPLTAWTAIFLNNNDTPQHQQRVVDIINKILTSAAAQEEYAARGIIVDTDHKINPNRWWQQEIKNYKAFAKLPQFQDLDALN
jgi:tripartite-type tricarboxylate transporter receptor subunit TctC